MAEWHSWQRREMSKGVGAGRVFPIVQTVKNLPAIQETWVWKMPWRRQWQPTPVFLPAESHGQRSLVGSSPWGHRESDMTKRLTHTYGAGTSRSGEGLWDSDVGAVSSYPWPAPHSLCFSVLAASVQKSWQLSRRSEPCSWLLRKRRIWQPRQKLPRSDSCPPASRILKGASWEGCAQEEEGRSHQADYIFLTVFIFKFCISEHQAWVNMFCHPLAVSALGPQGRERCWQQPAWTDVSCPGK